MAAESVDPLRSIELQLPKAEAFHPAPQLKGNANIWRLLMKYDADVRNRLKELFTSQKLAVLATQEGSQPYTSLMSFVATDDLKYIVFVTGQSTRKYENITRNPHVALLIDSRANLESDINDALAVTAIGKAGEVEPEEKDYFISLYREKHPHLEEFLMSPSHVLIKVTIQSYVVVNRFQNVSEFIPFR